MILGALPLGASEAPFYPVAAESGLGGAPLAALPLDGSLIVYAVGNTGGLLGFGTLARSPLGGTTLSISGFVGALLGFGPLASAPLAGFLQPGPFIVRPPALPRYFVLAPEEMPVALQRARRLADPLRGTPPPIRRRSVPTSYKEWLPPYVSRHADSSLFAPKRHLTPTEHAEPPTFDMWLRAAHGNLFVPRVYPIIWVNT